MCNNAEMQLSEKWYKIQDLHHKFKNQNTQPTIILPRDQKLNNFDLLPQEISIFNYVIKHNFTCPGKNSTDPSFH